MKTRILESEALYSAAAEEIRGLLERKPDAAVAMAAGRTMLPLWEKLRELDLSRMCFFEVAEFEDVPEEESLRAMTEAGLNLNPERCFWLTKENFSECDDAIAAAGGLDLAVLGIGDNAHIGLNEPATQFDTRCRRQKLTTKTKEQYAWRFGNAESAPVFALTMGIHTLCDARKILVLATGEEKAKAVFNMLYARDDSIIPAAFLQIPSEVTVYADPKAAEQL